MRINEAAELDKAGDGTAEFMSAAIKSYIRSKNC